MEDNNELLPTSITLTRKQLTWVGERGLNLSKFVRININKEMKKEEEYNEYRARDTSIKENPR